MSQPSVAVVVTTYNHAHFLLDALQSVSAQTRAADEIVVVDDGSTDDPAAVAARFPGVKLLRQSNRGLAAARNAGLATVSSEKVVFLDADDRLLPGALAAGLARFASAPSDCGLVYGGYRHIDEHGRPLERKMLQTAADAQPYRQLLRQGNMIGMHATAMYDRRRLQAAGAFDASLPRCEDYDAFLRMARHAPIVSYPELVAEYRQHGRNMSHRHGEMLEWALRVHARHAPAASDVPGIAHDWRQGRRFWRRFYASEMLGAARRQWSVHRSFGGAAARALAAARVWPPCVLGELVRLPRRLARRTLVALGVRARRGSTPARIAMGDLDRVTPVSDNFGYDRGTPIDRHYIERFLQRHADDIAGRALEVGDDAYCRRFGGGRVARQDVLHVNPGNPAATIVGDLSVPGTLPTEGFDCLVLTQTLHLVFDMPAAVREMHHSLKPGGVVLLTVPGISRIDRDEWGSRWYWSLTRASALRLFEEVFGAGQVDVHSHGNVYAATAFLHGLALEEIDRGRLETDDPCFPVIVTVRARKRAGA